MKIGIYGNNYQEAHRDELSRFIGRLRADGFTAAVHADFADYLSANGIEVADSERVEALPADARMVVSIGGDGTFLQAADWVGSMQTPIMGINTGHLGYLTGFSFRDTTSIFAALRGSYELSSRMALRVISDFVPEGFSPYGLNEISISKGDTTSMVQIRASIDGRFMADYQADGLVIATPTGSTAYNLSCGGPIMQPTLDSIVLSPIAPHSLTQRPLVVAAGSALSFDVRSRGAECHIGVDGRTFSVPASGTSLRVTAAPHRVNVVQPAGTDFAAVLRNKLGWGG